MKTPAYYHKSIGKWVLSLALAVSLTACTDPLNLPGSNSRKPGDLEKNGNPQKPGELGKTDVNTSTYTITEALEVIPTLNSESLIAITGNLTQDDIDKLSLALQSLDNEQTGLKASVKLDISNTTGLTGIGKSSFRNCKALTEISLPADITIIDDYAFQETSLTSIIIPEGVTDIGISAFNVNLDLTSVSFPSTLKTIGAQAFNNAAFTELNLPEGLRTIGEAAFSNLKSLTSVVLPSTLRQIDNAAFMGCTALETVQANRALIPTELGRIFKDSTSVFDGCTSLKEIRVPQSALRKYKKAEGWKNYADKIIAN